MTPPRPIGLLPIGLLPIGAMSSGQVFLGELLSSRARLRFPSRPHRLSINSRSSSKSKRTAYREIPNCLTQGVHPNDHAAVNTQPAVFLLYRSQSKDTCTSTHFAGYFPSLFYPEKGKELFRPQFGRPADPICLKTIDLVTKSTFYRDENNRL